ncbi:MAG: hypothetical protein HY587_04455 [Candidatus Omnitrophica bacterium]|nr:hypothetical protein [Candidatus Omnitrophota bacterium]
MKTRSGVHVLFFLTLCLFSRPSFAQLDQSTEVNAQMVTLDVREADIGDVLNMLAEQYNLNIVVGEDVSGVLSLRLDEVTLHGALQAMLLSRGYDYEASNNIIRVAPAEVLASERQIRQEREGIEPLVTEVVTLRYLDANDVRRAVDGLASSRGTISVLERHQFGGFQFGSQAVSVGEAGSASSSDGLVRARRGSQESTSPRSRTLLITDTRSAIERIKTVIRSIDIQPKQILIDAKILEVETDTLEDIGIEYDAGFTPDRELNLFDNIISAVNQGTSATAFPSASAQGVHLQFRKVKDENYEVLLHALLEDDRTRTLSSPQILVLDGQEAAILVGEQFPIFSTTVSDQGTATEALAFFQPVGISLQVIPQITADDHINMVIHPTVSAVGDFVTGSTGLSQPRINIREADTQLLVKNNETIILGGLIEDVDAVREFRVPILGHMPLIGALFTRTRTDIDQKNLILFITPKIVDTNEKQLNAQAELVYRGLNNPERYITLRERRKRISKYLGQGKEAFRINDLEKSAELFQHVLEIDPDNKTAKTYIEKLAQMARA